MLAHEGSAGMMLSQSLQSASLTDPGRVRDHNEDCIESRPDIGLYVLADGMGGYNAGEVASGMATSLISDGLQETWHPRDAERLGRDQAKAETERLIPEQIARANNAIFTTSQNNPECAGMGTTLVVTLFFDNFMTVAHIGDSRLYRLRGDAMEQVTRDHSLLQEQLDSGLITPEEAKLSQNKNLVTRALGIDPTVDPEVHVHEARTDDIYLLCSDGLSDMVDDDGIAKILAQEIPLEQKVAMLVDAANANGGRDNISVLVAQANEGSRKKGLISRLLGK
jgi:protein phosphatase